MISIIIHVIQISSSLAKVPIHLEKRIRTLASEDVHISVGSSINKIPTNYHSWRMFLKHLSWKIHEHG